MARTPTTVEEQSKQLRMLWGCLLSAVPLYGTATFVKLSGTRNVGDGTTLRNVFTLVAIVIGAISLWWWRHFLSAESSPTVVTPLSFRQLQIHSLISWLCGDAIALCGLAVAFLLRDSSEFVPFGVAGAVLLVKQHPFRLPYERLRVTA